MKDLEYLVGIPILNMYYIFESILNSGNGEYDLTMFKSLRMQNGFNNNDSSLRRCIPAKALEHFINIKKLSICQKQRLHIFLSIYDMTHSQALYQIPEADDLICLVCYQLASFDNY